MDGLFVVDLFTNGIGFIPDEAGLVCTTGIHCSELYPKSVPFTQILRWTSCDKTPAKCFLTPSTVM